MDAFHVVGGIKNLEHTQLFKIITHAGLRTEYKNQQPLNCVGNISIIEEKI